MSTLALLSVGLALGQTNLTFEAKLKSVAVFRDGYGFYIREGRAKLEDGWASTGFVPRAIKGSIWVYTLDPGDSIDTVLTTREHALPVGSAADLKRTLADKIGLGLIVSTKSGQRFEGGLRRLLDDMMLLQNGAAFSAIPYDQIAAITLAGFPLKVKVATKEPNKVASIGIAYLQEGIRWEPSYTLERKGAKAVLTLRASINNTGERLEGGDVRFVVGSPFVINRGLGDLSSLLPPPAAAGQPAPEADAKATPRPPQPVSAPPNVAVDEAAELYYYTKTGLTLATNDVAMVTLLRAEVPVTPVFEWNADGEDVAFLMRLSNSTKEPLASGPVFVLDGGKALGQENLPYTAAGAATEVRLARGVGLKVERTDAEVRRGGAVKVGRSEYVPIVIRGTLTVENRRGEEAEVRIRRTARGKVLEQSESGRIRNTQLLGGEPNPIHDLEWTVRVPAGGRKSVTYLVETLMAGDRVVGSPEVEP